MVLGELETGFFAEAGVSWVAIVSIEDEERQESEAVARLKFLHTSCHEDDLAREIRDVVVGVELRSPGEHVDGRVWQKRRGPRSDQGV